VKQSESETETFYKPLNVELSFEEAVVLHGAHSGIYFMNDRLKIKKSLIKINRCLSENPNLSEDEFNETYFLNETHDLKEKLNKHQKGFFLLDDFLLAKENLAKTFFSYVERNNLKHICVFEMCPCGKAELGKSKKCGLSLYRCRSKIEKLSLHTLSYFDLCFTDYKSDKPIKKESLQVAREIKASRVQKTDNSLCSFKDLQSTLSQETRSLLYLPSELGLKRQTSILSVARTIADLKGHECIESSDVELSMEIGYNRFKTLINMF